MWGNKLGTGVIGGLIMDDFTSAYRSCWRRYKRNLRWKSTMRKTSMSHGLTPCPDCGGDIQQKSSTCQACGGAGQSPRSPGPSGRPRYNNEMCEGCHGSGNGESWYQCAGCGKTWDDTNETAAQLLPNTPCPQCGRRMYFRDGASLGRMWPNGAWECESGDYSHMLRPEDLVPDTYQDPDAPGDFTLPEGFA